MDVTPERVRRLPKTELHVHLDGSLRPATLLELARETSIHLPVSDADALAAHMYVTDARDLVDYLARFEITLGVMQSEDALERIAFELAEDLALENVRYTEIRFAPVLNTRRGLSPEQVLEATLRGLLRARQQYGIGTAIIVCGLRNLPPATSIGMARLAVAYHSQGVVGFDLAGPEKGHPPSEHLEACRIAAEGNLAVTIHAGEAYGPKSIREAVHVCGARRLGHGTRLTEDRGLMGYVNDFRIPVECCLTSNVQTRVVPDYASHPLRLMYDEGLAVTLCTDNRLMSRTTVTDEYLQAHRALGFDWEELCDLALMGFEAAFLPRREKLQLLTQVHAEMSGI